jgi:four helix bundle protein
MTQKRTFPPRRPRGLRRRAALTTHACKLADGIPRGRRRLADQLIRAGTSVPLLIAEGANRQSRADKAHKFTEARGETAECGACADIVLAQQIGGEAQARELLALARGLGALLTGLIARYSDAKWARAFRGKAHREKKTPST